MDLKLRFALAFSAIFSVLIGAFSAVVYLQVEQRLLNSAEDALSEHVAHEINHITLYKGHEDSHPSTLTNKDIFQRIWKDTILTKDSFPPTAPDITPETVNLSKDNLLVQKAKQKVDGADYDIVAYYDLGGTKRYLHTLGKVLALGCVFALVLILPLSWVLTKLLLRPFQELASRTQRLDVKQLSFRFPEPMKKDEFGILVRSFNSLLERLERSFRQIYRFASSASHELRTPLTVIRGEAELMLRRQRETSEYEKGFRNILNQAETLERITSRLLFLADVERMEHERKTVSIPVSQTIRETVDSVLKVHHSQHRNVEVSGSGETFLGQREILISIVSNLVGNAFKYSKSQIRVVFRKDHSGLLLQVEDDGPGIPESQREDVFEPFFRAEGAKSMGGHGLGLSIVKACVGAGQGEIKLDRSSLGGLLVEVRLPELI